MKPIEEIAKEAYEQIDCDIDHLSGKEDPEIEMKPIVMRRILEALSQRDAEWKAENHEHKHLDEDMCAKCAGIILTHPDLELLKKEYLETAVSKERNDTLDAVEKTATDLFGPLAVGGRDCGCRRCEFHRKLEQLRTSGSSKTESDKCVLCGKDWISADFNGHVCEPKEPTA